MTAARAALAGLVWLAATAAGAAQSGQVVNNQDTVAMAGAVLRGLDTLDGEAEDLALAQGETAVFGYLEITLDACRAPRGAASSDAYAFLRIRDVREAQARFQGWMFASSPALSALDHPRYDVWVLSCSNP